MRSGGKVEPALRLGLALIYLALLAYALVGGHSGGLPAELDRLREAIRASAEVFRL